MNTLIRQSSIALACVAAFTLAACGGSGGGVDDQATPPSAGSTGFLNLSVSDAPIKAAKVCIRFDGVELKHADSDEKETIDFDDPEVVNLLANQGANSHPIVTNAAIPAGRYEWVRLKVQAERGLGGGVNDGGAADDLCDPGTENSYLVRESASVADNLFIPSGSQRGLQLIKDITILANRSGDFTAEWDLGKSFNGPPGLAPDVMMKPVVKLVANNEVGTLVGQVADELVALDSCDAEFAPSVYVFDDGVAPNALDDPFADDDAVATGLVEQQEQEDGSMPWRYSIGFLLAGNYEAAFTCNGTDFIPVAGKPAEIMVDEVTMVDFVAEDAPPPVGSLSGTVAVELVGDASCTPDTFDAAVYVFGEGVTPNTADTPVAVGAIVTDVATEPSVYSIADLVAGTYTAAFTCNGTAFVPVDGKPAPINIGEDTTVNFDAGDAS